LLGREKGIFTKEFIEKTKEWLGEDGVIFFREVKEKYGSIGTAVWMENGIPHPVHFREGMKVRNFIRTSNEFPNWDSNDYDANWIFLIEEAIK
jgi:spermidine synthase